MKCRAFIVLLLFCLIFFNGCGPQNLSDFSNISSYDSAENMLLPTAFTYEEGPEAMPPQFRHSLTEMGDYIYYDDGISLVRLNSKTGDRSYLCADPLCEHQVGCEYRRSYMRSVCAGDGKLFFWRKYDSDEMALIMYDTKTAKQSTVCPWATSGTQVPVSVYHSPYIYYYIVASEETAAYKVGDVLMHQVNVQTMEDCVLCTFPGGKYGYCAGIYQGDTLIMTTEQIIRLSASSDEQFVLIRNDDLYGSTIYCNSYCLQGSVLRFFSTSNTVADTPKTYFWEYDLACDTLKEIAYVDGEIIMSSFCYTENALYYRINETYTMGTLVAENNANSGEVVLNKPNFYRLNYDTAEVDAVLLQLPAEYQTCNLSNEFVVLGNYIYIKYNHYGPVKEDGIYSEADFSGGLSGLMRIDVRDGSLIYVGGK